jgi:hypothetical protein
VKNTPKTIILNQDLVREKLRQKKYDEVCLSSWGRLDEFIQFISSFGVFSMLAQLGLATGHSGIPSFLLAMLVFVKPVFNIRFCEEGDVMLSAPPTPPDVRITYPAIRLVKTDTNEHLVCLAYNG